MMEHVMTHLSLFSGIGGLDLAAERAGFHTIGQCEWADYPTRVLEKHWPNVPRWRDIRTLTKESFYERTGLRTVGLISDGFPCQPFSVAGKRRGCEDDRYLWPEMCRVIEELRPRWVVGENVAGIVNMALDQVLSDLESIGYTTGAFIIPACGVNAPHRRDRVAILAHAKKDNGNYGCTQEKRNNRETTPLEHRGRTWWDTEPGVCRVVDGVPTRVDIDRNECLGNAVVPQQFYQIFKAIMEQLEKTGGVRLEETMERLTEHHVNKSFGAYMVCSETCDNSICRVDCKEISKIVDRLAADEDTGLEPEKIKNLKSQALMGALETPEMEEYSGSALERADRLIAEYESIGHIDHLRELVQAEKDGHLAVLPCKVGDTAWFISIAHKTISQYTVAGYLNDGLRWKVRMTKTIPSWVGNQTEHKYAVFNSFGKTVFLTREEAEAALKKREEAGL